MRIKIFMEFYTNKLEEEINVLHQQLCKEINFKNLTDNFNLDKPLKIAIDLIEASSEFIDFFPKKILSKLDYIIKCTNQLNKRYNNSVADLTNYYRITEKISRNTGLNKVSVEQELLVSISPLDKTDFRIKNIEYDATGNDNLLSTGSLLLSNYHILELNISEKQYGLKGNLTFELCYFDDQNDFNFLFEPNDMMLLYVNMSDGFVTPSSKTTGTTNRDSKFVAIGRVIEIDNNPIKYYVSDDSEVRPSIKTFKIEFHDPLKAIWSLHQPTYIDYNKSIGDILEDNLINNFKSQLFEVDYKSCKWLNDTKIDQIFISSLGRNFYDHFIELIASNNCIIKYDSNPLTSDDDSSLPIYYIADNINELESIEKFKKVQNYKKQKFSTMYEKQDLLSIESQKTSYINVGDHVEKKYVDFNILSINESDGYQDTHKKKIEEANKNTVKTDPFKFIYKTIDRQDYSLPSIRCIELKANSRLPNLYTEIDFSKLENKIESNEIKRNLSLNCEVFQNFYIREKNIALFRSRLHSKLLYKNLFNKNVYLEKTDDRRKSEQISLWLELREKNSTDEIGMNSLTHFNKIKYIFGSYEDRRPEYPEFKTYNKFHVVGKVIVNQDQISNKENKENNKQYRFFKDYELKESDFKEHKQGSAVYYAVEVPCSLFHSRYDGNPVIYIPVDINLNSKGNEFSPLRNGDFLMVEAIGLNKCRGYKVISSSAINDAKATDIHSQRHLLGSVENCIVAYDENYMDDKDKPEKKYFIQQANKEHDNEFSLANNKEGLSLVYRAKN